MKIIIVIGKFPQLSETFIIRKAVALSQAGHDVLVMSRRRGDQSILNSYPDRKFNIEFLLADTGPFSLEDICWNIYRLAYYTFLFPIKIVRLIMLLVWEKPHGSFIRNFLRFLPFCNKQYDIAHIEFLSMGPNYQLIKKITGNKLVVSCRGADMHLLPLKPKEVQESFKSFFGKIDAVHCVSDEMQAQVKLFAGAVPYIFVNRPAIDEKLCEHGGDINNEVPVIISTGRLEWKKGFDYLIKAYALLVEEGIRFKAFIIGGGSLHNELAFSVKDAGLSDYLYLLGPKPSSQVLSRLKEANIFVLSSVEEGISNAVLEAMALGVPVVSTRCGGMEEVIRDGVDGLLVPVRDPFSMMTAIKRLIKDEATRNVIKVNARNKIKEAYTLTRQVMVFEQAYHKILGNN